MIGQNSFFNGQISITAFPIEIREVNMNKKAFQNITYGVYIISTKDNERPTGCIANSVMQITSDPATIAISINHDNYTNKCIERTGKFAVTVLSNNCDPAIIGTFGLRKSK